MTSMSLTADVFHVCLQLCVHFVSNKSIHSWSRNCISKEKWRYYYLLPYAKSCSLIQLLTPKEVRVWIILYNVGVLDHFWSPVVPCYSTEDAVQIVNSFITIPTTHNYIHSQLFLTPCHIYTAYNHTRSWLQSLITLLHWLTSQLSITVSNYHRLYFILFFLFGGVGLNPY
jgi:hypothetical protein